MSTRARFASTRLATLALSLLALGAEAQPLSPVIGQAVPQSRIQAWSASGGDAEKSGHLVRSSSVRSSGKYYFEVVVDSSTNREDLEALVIARVNDGTRWFGNRHHILLTREDASIRSNNERHHDIAPPKVVMGIAVDLDAGRFYRHRDGLWLGGAAPGSPRGIELRRGVPYVAEVASSAPLDPLLRNHIVTVNFGNAPFLRHPPEGYAGFDSTAAVTDGFPPAEAAVAFPYQFP
jgi:hypothetical protein